MTSPPFRTQRSAAPYFWLLLILCVAYLPLFYGQIIFFRDPAHWNYPARWFLRTSLLRGDVPSWNPDQGLGFSVFGNPLYGLFYPPNWLYLLGAPQSVVGLVNWQSFAHMVWGSAGVLLLARRLGAGHAAAVVTAVSWGLSGFTTSMWTAGLLLLAGAWVPWCAVGFVALARSLRRPGFAWLGGIVKAAAPVALTLLMGEIFVAMMGVAFGLATAAAVTATDAPPLLAAPVQPRWRWFVAPLGALVLAAAIGAITVLPARAVAAATDRAQPLARNIAEACSLHPLRLFEFVAPEAMGYVYEHYPGGKWVGEPAFGDLPLTFSVYFGTSALALALIAFGRGRRLATALAALAGLALLVSLGKYTPVHQALRTLIPPLKYMRYPEKYIVLIVGWVSLLAGLGASRIFSTSHPQRQPWLRTLVFGFLLLTLAALARALFPIEFGGYIRVGALRGAAAVAGILAVQALAPRRRAAAAVLLVACVATDLAAAAWPLQGFGPRRIATSVPPAVKALLQDYKGSLVPPRLYRADKVESSVGRFVRASNNTEGELRSMLSMTQNTMSTFGVANLPGYDAAIPSTLPLLWVTGQKVGQSVLRLLAIDYALLPVKDPDAADQRFGLHRLFDPLPGSRLYRVEDPLPRVYLAGRAEVAADDDALKHLFEPDIVAGGRVLLAPGADAATRTGSAARVGDCRLEAFSNARVAATCRADRPGVAVFVEQYGIGWRADVDGHPAPLLRANLLMRAVSVDAGTHRIVLSYTPPAVKTAAVISILALLALALLAIARRVLERRIPVEAAPAAT